MPTGLPVSLAEAEPAEGDDPGSIKLKGLWGRRSILRNARPRIEIVSLENMDKEKELEGTIWRSKLKGQVMET